MEISFADIFIVSSSLGIRFCTTLWSALLHHFHTESSYQQSYRYDHLTTLFCLLNLSESSLACCQDRTDSYSNSYGIPSVISEIIVGNRILYWKNRKGRQSALVVT